jgi:bifunctional enzyme CysN/CysC
VLDGDNLRRGVNSDLGFSAKDRTENIRRAGEIAALFADAGLVVLAAFISPYARDRATARRAAGAQFHEVFVRASLDACEKRDPRGLYRRARSGEIAEFTGVSAPYEAPAEPELELDTEQLSADEAVERLVAYIDERLRVDSA